MAYEIEYFHPRVLADIERWPVDVLADYAHLVELLAEHGPDLRMPHSRAMGDGLFEIRPRGREGIGRAFYCFRLGRRIVVLHACCHNPTGYDLTPAQWETVVEVMR